jgi:hypothetical protein
MVARKSWSRLRRVVGSWFESRELCWGVRKLWALVSVWRVVNVDSLSSSRALKWSVGSSGRHEAEKLLVGVDC